ncbi:DUF1934 family protein [Metabacillus indicus]|jgi:uncharacterized beta-barrel protein YwiB (DUF1934 family)|uniref:DUF1934 domain-containing protein n=1 Tax=Metabacillus indicus TaxID=246786 RepID=A0A084GNW4_METID|nr:MULTISPECIES: DUF1934 family protein [Metabacillus]KEZ49026.1 hypothetical protein GS18_0216590 [Metabacillus indicus]MDX8289737.1 DUF1934 family protein [Metabacillus indicus]
MTASKPVQVIVKTEINQGGDTENLELFTSGEHYVKNNASYLSYHEEHEYGKVKTVVKFRDDEVFIMRSGAVSMKQRFVKDVDTMTNYRTQFGELRLETRTKAISVRMTDGNAGGIIRVQYELQIGEEDSHSHMLTIMFREEKG